MECPVIEKDNVGYRSKRINVLLALAYTTVILCLIVTIWQSDMGEYAQGVVTLVLGRFLGYADQVYSFEFGTTSNSKAKDDTIATLTASAIPQQTTTTTQTVSTEKVGDKQPKGDTLT